MGSIRRQTAVLIGRDIRPAYFDALTGQLRLEGFQAVIVFLHLMRREAIFQAVRRKHPGHFADVPFERMQAVATIGNMRRADVLAGRDEIFHPLRDQRTERNFKRAGWYVDIVVAACRWMQVDAVHADTDAVAIADRPSFAANRVGQVLLDNTRYRLDTAAFANVRSHGKPMVGAGDIATQPKPAEPLPAIKARRFRLKPVKDRIRKICRRLQVARLFFLGHIDDRAIHVIDHRPIHEADVRLVEPGRKVLPCRDAPENPEILITAALSLVGIDQQRVIIGIWREGAGGMLQRARMGRGEAEERTTPEMRLIRAPIVVVLRLVDRLVAIDMVNGKAD